MVNKIKIRNKRGQVTIFIIICLLIVASILLILYLSGKISFINSPAENPESYLRNCMMTSIKDAEKIIIDNNGYPQIIKDNYVLYNKEKVPYMCTAAEFYSVCTPQEPAFFSYVSELIENKVARDTQTCLDNLVEDLKNKGYTVQVDLGNVTLKVQKDFIAVNFGKRIYATRNEDAIQISNIEISHSTKLYDMIKLIQTIVNYESTVCEFDKMNWMRHDSSILIFSTRTSDQTKIYTLQDRLTEREIKFAIKTCVLPAGI